MTGDPHVDARLSAWKPAEREPDPQRLHEQDLHERRAIGRRSTLIARLRSILTRRG
ncbi:MAG: hypothetical protein QOH61_1992 [Chloroflexota bacterium]|jgi:hypothetical protein|nr:hypothetical protein [Chloroflexota bacterium]